VKNLAKLSDADLVSKNILHKLDF